MVEKIDWDKKASYVQTYSFLLMSSDKIATDGFILLSPDQMERERDQRNLF